MKVVNAVVDEGINPGTVLRFLQKHFFGVNGLIRALLVLNVVGLVGIWASSVVAEESRSELLLVPMTAASETKTGEARDIKPVAAPILSTRISSTITGHIVRTTVTQTFSNPTGNWMEGMYYFPLPDDSSVDRMHLKIGERIIISEIQEKEQAQKTYTKAAAEGKVSALLTQYRPNVFSTRVANIEPGGSIDVEISFQGLAAQDGASFTWRMPQAITPRFDPSMNRLKHLTRLDPQQNGTQNPNSGEGLPKEENYHPEGGQNMTAFEIVVRRADQLASLESASHAIVKTDLPGNDVRLQLKDGHAPADRDFILSWTFEQTPGLKPVLFREQVGDAVYTLGFLLPPVDEEKLPALPRDVTFIVDVSGSMHGTSMEQAKEAMLTALDLLKPEDLFEIIVFNDQYFRLFEKSLPASRNNLDLARKFVGRLKADNGTVMFPALDSALSDPVQEGYQRQVLFLTDGAVTNEAEMFKLVSDKLGQARLFTVGVGSAPNGWFMRKAAEFGKGIHIQIFDIHKAKTELEALFRDMARPALQDINVHLAADADIYPKIIPDLFGQRPLIFAAREQGSTDDARVLAKNAEGQVVEFGLAGGEQLSSGQGISKLWASKKVEGLMDAGARGMDADIVRTAVLDVALAHQIMSPYTSFVAVDKTPVRVKEDFLQKMKATGNMPAGTSWKKIHGPQTASPMALYALTGMGFLLLSMMVLAYRWRKEVRS